MTDVASYLNLLFATIAQPHCPRTGEPAPSRSSSQILEAILSLPEGTEIELRAPVFKIYGEDLDFVFTEIRKKGCRRLIVDGKPVDLEHGGTRARRRRRLGTARRRGSRPPTPATFTATPASTASSSVARTRRRSRQALPRRCWSATA
jgi:hypothetical protein